MNIKQVIYEIEKNKACELFYSEIIEYVQSINKGEPEVFDSDILPFIDEAVTSLINTLEEKRKTCYDTVINLQNIEIKNVRKNNTTRNRKKPVRKSANSKSNRS